MELTKFPEPVLVPDTFAAPDQTGQPGNWKVVRPKNVDVPDAGQDVQDWQSAQGLDIGGRRYDFLVDRARQVWWPADPGDHTTSYLGRWGSRVIDDPFGRRAGMRFPLFWKMFFLALVKGKAAGVL